MILDDGGDATLLVHQGVAAQAAGEVPADSDDDSQEFRIIKATLREAHQLVEGGRLVGKLVLRGWE